MFGRSRSWVGGGHGKSSRNIHSLDHLKYLYHVLTKNTTVTEQNRNLLVETIRSITEILIWGDQNDSSVFEYGLQRFCVLVLALPFGAVPSVHHESFLMTSGTDTNSILPEYLYQASLRECRDASQKGKSCGNEFL